MYQFYLFTMPDDDMPIWAEMYGPDDFHMVGPTTCAEMPDAIVVIEAANPGAIVDTLCMPLDIEECREWARIMPLEQIK